MAEALEDVSLIALRLALQDDALALEHIATPSCPERWQGAE